MKKLQVIIETEQIFYVKYIINQKTKCIVNRTKLDAVRVLS
jgi:hypothetical protein